MIGRIRWQIIIAVCTALVVFGLLGSLALSTSASTRPLSGEVYVEGVVGSPQQLNPLAQDASASPAERDIAALLFDGLTRIGPDGRVEPSLAERWTVSPNGRTYTFILRGDRTWHDGAPVTTDDVLYTVRGVQNANFPGDRTLAALWRNVLVRKLDSRTVEFTLSAPFAPFPSVARLPLLPSHLLRTLRPEQWPNAPYSQRPVGTGQYRLHALDPQQAVLVPAADAPGETTAIDNVVFRFYPTADAAILGLTRREVQGVATVASAGRLPPIPARHVQRMLAPLDEYAILTLNLQQAPLDDIQLRRALAMSINRDALITNVLGGQGQPLDTPILLGTWAENTTARLPEFRRSEAQQVLGSLGYRLNNDGWLEADGQRLVLPLLITDAPETAAIANELARQLAEIGVELQIRRVDGIELQTALAAHNFTLALHTWSDVGADPDVFSLWHSSRADGGTNYAALRDERVDQLLSEARTTTDEATRQRLYADFQQRWVELVPSIPLYRSVLAYDVAAATPPPPSPGIIPGRSERFRLLEQWLSAQR